MKKNVEIEEEEALFRKRRKQFKFRRRIRRLSNLKEENERE